MKRKLVAALACRNTGSRLYGKPLQKINDDRHDPRPDRAGIEADADDR